MGSDNLPEDWIGNGQEPIMVTVVAPSVAVRTGLRHLLSDIPDVEVVWESDTIEELEDIAPRGDILVIAPGSSSGENIMEALESMSSVRVLLLLGDDRETKPQMPKRSDQVWGILSIDASIEEIGAAIHALSAGLLVGTPTLFDPLLLDVPNHTGGQVYESLTGRESEVLQLLARGLANKQIALQLGISEHTVKFHVSGIYSKLGASNRTEAVRLGVRQGLILL